IPFRLATTLAACFSSGSSALRNLAAQRSMGPSMLTSTVSLALAESFCTSAGILMSWPDALGGSATNRARAIARDSAAERALCRQVVIFIAVSITFALLIVLFPFLLVLGPAGVVFVRIDFIGINLVDPGPGELQLASCDAQSQKQALFGRFSLGALASHVAVMDAADDQGCGNGRHGCPAGECPGKSPWTNPWNERLSENLAPRIPPGGPGTLGSLLRGTGQHAVGKTLWRFPPAQRVLQFVIEMVHRLLLRSLLSLLRPHLPHRAYHFLAQHGERTLQMASDRGDRRFQDIGNLFRRQVFLKAQDHDQPRFSR